MVEMETYFRLALSRHAKTPKKQRGSIAIIVAGNTTTEFINSMSLENGMTT